MTWDHGKAAFESGRSKTFRCWVRPNRVRPPVSSKSFNFSALGSRLCQLRQIFAVPSCYWACSPAALTGDEVLVPAYASIAARVQSFTRAASRFWWR